MPRMISEEPGLKKPTLITSRNIEEFEDRWDCHEFFKEGNDFFTELVKRRSKGFPKDWLSKNYIFKNNNEEKIISAIKKQSLSVCLLISSDYLQEDGDGYFYLKTKRKLKEVFHLWANKSNLNHKNLPVCSYFKKKDQLCLPGQTGILLENNHILTTAHGTLGFFRKQKVHPVQLDPPLAAISCPKFYAVFGYRTDMEYGNNDTTMFPAKDVYEIGSAVCLSGRNKSGPDDEYEVDDETDWALLKLKEGTVVSKTWKPLTEFCKENPPSAEDYKNDTGFSYLIGHSLGQPLKIILESKVKAASFGNVPSFEGFGDNFIGQSGSPIFDAKTYRMVGILTSGSSPEVRIIDNQCLSIVAKPRYTKKADSKGVFHDFTYIGAPIDGPNSKTIYSLIKEILNKK